MAHQGLKTVTYKAPHTGRRALLCLLLGAAILAFSWQAQRRLGVAQPFGLGLGGAMQAQDAPRTSREVALSAHTLYALQLGAFTQERAALQLAQEFSSRGAAGFVYRDGDTYRVLAAGYPTRAEAQAVQTRLNGQGVSTYIHPCAQQALALRAGGADGQVAALEEALGYLDGLDAKLYTLSAALDAREIDGEEARAALQSEGVTSGALRRRLLDSFGEGLPDSLQPLAQTMADLADAGEAARNENSAARVGAALKRCQLIVFFGLDAFARGLV